MARGRKRGLKQARAQARALRFGPVEKSRADLVLSNIGTMQDLRKRFKLWLDNEA